MRPFPSQAPLRATIGRLLLLLLLASLGAGCGGRRAPELEPPRVSIVELTLAEGRAAVRVDNPVRAAMPATTADLTIAVEGRTLLTVSRALDLAIPPLGSELIQVPLDSASPGARYLDGLGPGARAAYQITGTVGLEGRSPLSVASTGWLTPNPGKPGSFR